MSLLSQENIIGQEELRNHNIKKYEFKSITSEMLKSGKIIEPSNEASNETSQNDNALTQASNATESQDTENLQCKKLLL